ncbi:hypothetical protein QBC32DRAFT_220416 [Pseudoneurospora amorphoporcata]|uniref:Uncharacterized protein n=1 Tax=Pseudoneurospora amorphoporcata TaxID=241081 RepID=A0AAN6NQH3_9PEZI|nr:hypothetical protein QBC32DRAFT_220416 [Pseudoneurospora amorphoporcata]
MCIERVYITVCWHCDAEHGASNTSQATCERARASNLRWGGCGYTSTVDHVRHSPCTSCYRRHQIMNYRR